MPEAEKSVKNRVLRAAQTLIGEKGIGAVTSRDIARRAGVGLGSINYHFASRDDLLTQAVLARFRSAVEDLRSESAGAADPKGALTQQMIRMLHLLVQFGETGKFALRHKLTRHMFTAERHMLKFISQWYGKSANPLELKLKAMQLSATIVMAFFNQEEFFRYADIDLYDSQDAARFVHALVDSVLIKPEGEGKYEA